MHMYHESGSAIQNISFFLQVRSVQFFGQLYIFFKKFGGFLCSVVLYFAYVKKMETFFVR